MIIDLINLSYTIVTYPSSSSQVHVLANEVLRKQYVFPGAKEQTAKTVQEYLGVGLKTATQANPAMAGQQPNAQNMNNRLAL